MGWFFLSYIDQGFIFGLFGLWYMYNNLNNYVKLLFEFWSLMWFFVLGCVKLVKFLELWIFFIIVVIFIFKQFLYVILDFVVGFIKMEYFGCFQYVIFVLFFLVYVIVGFVDEYMMLLCLFVGVFYCIFVIGFFMEFVVFYFGYYLGDDVKSFVYMLMQIIFVFLVLFMFFEVLYLYSIFVFVGWCIMFILKGIWFVQIGFLIYYLFFVLLGCYMMEEMEYFICFMYEVLMWVKLL